jgi:phosphatidate cytidylyltransferase
MIQRSVVGVIAAVFTVLLVLQGPTSLQWAVILIFSALSYLELDRLFFPARSPMRQFRGVGLVLLGVVLLALAPEKAALYLWFPLAVLAAAYVRRANKKGEFEQAVKGMSLELLSTVYSLCTVGFFLPILHLNFGREFLLLLFFLVFAGDTFAYFVGTLWGRRRIASHVSPKKSWEGAMGAVVGALLFAWIWLSFVYHGPRSERFVLGLFCLAPILCILGQMGDLLESMLKRSRAQKDSGLFLPGHGGFLDRTDGLTLSAPAFYFILRAMGDVL